MAYPAPLPGHRFQDSKANEEGECKRKQHGPGIGRESAGSCRHEALLRVQIGKTERCGLANGTTGGKLERGRCGGKASGDNNRRHGRPEGRRARMRSAVGCACFPFLYHRVVRRASTALPGKGVRVGLRCCRLRLLRRFDGGFEAPFPVQSSPCHVGRRDLSAAREDSREPVHRLLSLARARGRRGIRGRRFAALAYQPVARDARLHRGALNGLSPPAACYPVGRRAMLPFFGHPAGLPAFVLDAAADTASRVRPGADADRRQAGPTRLGFAFGPRRHLRAAAAADGSLGAAYPVSVEWSVPYANEHAVPDARPTAFHLGVHDLPSASASEWIARLNAFTAMPPESRPAALLGDLLAEPERAAVCAGICGTAVGRKERGAAAAGAAGIVCARLCGAAADRRPWRRGGVAAAGAAAGTLCRRAAWGGTGARLRRHGPAGVSFAHGYLRQRRTGALASGGDARRWTAVPCARRETGAVAEDERFAAAIAGILGCPGSLSAMRAACRAYALGCNWDNVFDGVYAGYRDLPDR